MQLTKQEADAAVQDHEDWGDKMDLSHVKDLDVGAAKALAKFEGDYLILDGLKTLSDKTAEALAKSNAAFLCLNGLQTISNKTAQALAKTFDPFGFGTGLELSNKVEAQVQQFMPECIDLESLKKASDIEDRVCTEAPKSEAPKLYVMGLKTLSDKAAQALGSFKGDCLELYAPGWPPYMKALSVEAAQSLAEFKGKTLFLGHLNTLSDNAVEALGAFKGELILKGSIMKKVEAAKKTAKAKKVVKKKAPAKKKAVKKAAKKVTKKKTANPIEGMKFVITGKLPSMGRSEATEIIEDNGGKVVTSISKNTDYLLSGEKTGTKLDKAKALCVKIISEQKLLKMLPQ